MTKASEQAIRDAVADCLRRCSLGGTPLGVIAETLGELRSLGWGADDVRKVEQTVLRVLAGVVTAEMEPEALPEWA